MLGFLAAVAAFIAGRILDGNATNKAIKRNDQHARQQHIYDMRMQLAKSLAPDTPTYGAQTSAAMAAMRAQADAMHAANNRATIGGAISLIPSGVSAIGNAFSQPKSLPLNNTDAVSHLSEQYPLTNPSLPDELSDLHW